MNKRGMRVFMKKESGKKKDRLKRGLALALAVRKLSPKRKPMAAPRTLVPKRIRPSWLSVSRILLTLMVVMVSPGL